MAFRTIYDTTGSYNAQDIYLALLLSASAYRPEDSVDNNLRAWIGVNNYFRRDIFGEVPSHYSMITDGTGVAVGVEGTLNLRDWLRNAAWGTLGIVPDHGGKCPSVYLQVAVPLVNAIKTAADGNTPLFLTGHSRGGAVACVAAAILRAQGYNVKKVITFGAPRIGNKTFTDAYAIETLQVKTFQDTIPNLPPSNVRFWSPAGELTGLLGDLSNLGIELGIGDAQGVLSLARQTFAYGAYLNGLNPGYAGPHSLANYIRVLTAMFQADRPGLLSPLSRYLATVAADWNFS